MGAILRDYSPMSGLAAISVVQARDSMHIRCISVPSRKSSVAETPEPQGNDRARQHTCSEGARLNVIQYKKL